MTAPPSGHDAHNPLSPSTNLIKGSLTSLRTKAEVDAHDETIQVYVCGVPVKETGKVLNAIKSIPNITGLNLQHLRRVVKDDYFSQQLKDVLLQYTGNSSVSAQENSIDEASTVNTPSQQLVYILLAPTSHISHESLQLLLAKHVPFYSTSMLSQSPPSIQTLLAPLYAPSTAAHAIEQSTTLWPTTYNPNTTYGPNPAIVAQAQEELEHNGEVDVYMTLARQAGKQVEETKVGLPIGVVVVERSEGQGRVVAVAGDARWAGCGRSLERGNPSGHAALRAIDFVAQKRRAIGALDIKRIGSDKAVGDFPVTHAFPAPVLSSSSDKATTNTDHTIAANYAAQVHHTALTPLEEHYLSLESNPGSPSPNGYLCLNLEVYLTHEPCVMCSMALVHSRVGRVVFGGSAGLGIATGALRAEVVGDDREPHEQDGGMVERVGGKRQHSPKYGLFWREDLNWRFNAWEWRAEEGILMKEMDEVGGDEETGSALEKSRTELADDVQI